MSSRCFWHCLPVLHASASWIMLELYDYCRVVWIIVTCLPAQVESGLANIRMVGASLGRAKWGGLEVLLTNSGKLLSHVLIPASESAGRSGIVFFEGAVPMFGHLVRDALARLSVSQRWRHHLQCLNSTVSISHLRPVKGESGPGPRQCDLYL